MSNINENIAKNITNLRKSNNLTQIDLANKLNYSDKAISKWERGESLPDIEMLVKIADTFNVDVNYLVNEHSENDIERLNNNKKLFVRNLLLLIFTSSTFLLISTIVFLIATLRQPENAKTMWISFVLSTPFIASLCEIYAKKEKRWLMGIISTSMILWTIITSIYCFSIVFSFQSMFWLIFILGAPIQALICLYFFWKRTF